MRTTHIPPRRISNQPGAESRRPVLLPGGGSGDGNFPAEETPRQRFRRLAEKRVPNAIKTIRLVGNLSNKSRYQWTSDDACKIAQTLREEVEIVILQLEGHGSFQAGREG